MPHFLNPNVFRADEKARAPPAQALTKSGGRCRSSFALVSMAVASYSSLQVRGHRGRGPPPPPVATPTAAGVFGAGPPAAAGRSCRSGRLPAGALSAFYNALLEHGAGGAVRVGRRGAVEAAALHDEAFIIAPAYNTAAAALLTTITFNALPAVLSACPAHRVHQPRHRHSRQYRFGRSPPTAGRVFRGFAASVGVPTKPLHPLTRGRSLALRFERGSWHTIDQPTAMASNATTAHGPPRIAYKHYCPAASTRHGSSDCRRR